jgi:DNA-binding response OmpR family regulator
MANILVVEDERALERIFLMNLVARGHAVAEADGVAEGLVSIQAAVTPFDLIILDINLPDGSGWDLLRLLRERQGAPVPPVIVVTALRPSQQRLDELKPDAVLLKPFPITTLLQLVERVLAGGNGDPFSASLSPEGGF